MARFKSQSYNSSSDVKKIMIRDSLYRHIHFINAEMLEKLDKGEAESDENMIYVFAQFFQPGMQNYVTCVLDNEGDLQFFTHKIIVPKRTEAVPNSQKYIRTIPVIREFRKEKSVFADWQVDDENTALNCMKHDIQHMAIKFFTKDPESEEVQELYDVIFKYGEQIKNIFIQLASRSNFPQIGFMDFSTFSNKVQIPDRKGEGLFGAQNVDIQYTSARQSAQEILDMDPSLLMRYQFVEILVRIAQGKYVQQKICNTVGEALDKLFKDIILPKYEWLPWQSYRDKVCYQLEVNDVLDTNIAGIQGLIEYYYRPRKRFMNRKDAVNLFTKDSSVFIGDKEALYCFGMSKMTVVEETRTAKFYNKLELCELCEMICRVADSKFKNASHLTYAQKIEQLLDELFVVTGY